MYHLRSGACLQQLRSIQVSHIERLEQITPSPSRAPGLKSPIMRAKRAKQYKKLMHAYALSFNFREPFQVLLDAQFILDASKFKMRLGSMLETTLHGSIKPMITQCCIRHLYNMPASGEEEQKQKEAWIEVAKAAERRRCDHHELEEPLSTLECLASVVDPKGSGTNRHRYVVASQDAEVRARMREVVGVPLVYINRSVMILEPMGEKTEEVREQEERGKVRAGLKGRRGGDGAGSKRKREDGDDGSASDAPGDAADITAEEKVAKKRKVKGPKAPNPLSVKKAKKDKTPIARQAEDERAVARKAAKQDPQAAEKAMSADFAVNGAGADGVADGQRKRKRKRKPKDVAQSTAAAVEVGDG